MSASTRRSAFLLVTSLAVIGSVGATQTQASEAPNPNDIRTASPRVVADPAQPPQGLSADAWGKIVRQVRESRYDVSRQAVTGGDEDAVWIATHPGLNLEFTFDSGGVHVQPRGAERRAWDWGMQLVGFGGDSALHPAEPLSPHVEGNRVEYRRPGLREWYVHDRRGVEQGFTIESAPVGDPERMQIALALSGTLAATVNSAGGGVTLRDAEGTTALHYGGLYAFDAAGRDLSTWMELRDDGATPQLVLWVDIRDADFPVVIDPLITSQVAKLTASDAESDDEFGHSVSISGDTVVVGAHLDDDGESKSGSAYVYDRNEGGTDSWGQVAKLTASDAESDDEFGHSVSISGDTVVVGALLDDDGGSKSGSAYVFERNEGGTDSWGQVAKLTASDAESDDEFGHSVSISGDTVVVGAHLDDDGESKSGSAYVFERNEGGTDSWGQVAKLTASDAESDDEFGHSVSISGDTVVVGALLDDDGGSKSGSAYVFERNEGGTDSWGQVAKLTASDAESDDEFGHSVSISGDTVVVGALLDDDGGSKSGSAYVFERNEGGTDSWGQVAKLTASDAESDDRFGHSVSISGDTVVVGAHLDDDGGSKSGSAYLYKRNEGGPDSWGQAEKLTASDAASDDRFGHSVSISGGTAVVGALLDDDGGSKSGSAYVYAFADSVCGDGIVDTGTGEDCDDGTANGTQGSCCSATCAFEPSTTVCRTGSGDVCDPDEVCTGLSTTCPADSFDPGTLVCNPGSGDLCDPDEVCPGVAGAACPADTIAAATTICNAGSGDLCDPDELCPGTAGGVCPADTVTAVGTTCRAGSGDLCDPDEECTGVADAACPAQSFEPATTVCNAGSGDSCDPDEMCPGTVGGACPADTVTALGTICRAGSGDLCDPDEQCTGVADAVCPADSFEPATTVCNAGSGDSCDPDEMCPGTPGGVCPADTVTAMGTICRPGSGDLCDPDDEECTGVADAACPAGSFEPATTVCNVGSGDSCDPDEMCPGTAGGACPADTFASASTVCRTGSGDSCDPDETCPGTAGGVCPADTVAAIGTICRAGSGDICDPHEECTGSAEAACPADSFEPTTTVCNVGSGDSCDPDETCPGTAGGACHPDGVLPRGTTCRAGSGDSCDPDEECPGTAGGTCPTDTVTAAGTTCRTGSGEVCDPDEECTGVALATCPADSFAPSGTACGDDLFCFGPGTCDGSGTCTSPVDNCDDSNECTEDTCNETGETCFNDSFCSMSGRVLYNQIVTGPADSPNPLNPIDDVVITLTGDGAGSTSTANDGTYSFVDEAGSVTVTPSRAATEDDVDLALSAADASSISKASVGLEPLTPKQFKAGDVSNNGSLSAFDSSLVARRALDIITTFSTLGGASWFFVPTASTEDVTTGSDVTDIDFCGVIYGDVTMNWTGPTTLVPAKSAHARESTEFGDLHASWQNIDPRQVRQMIINPSLEARIYVAQGLREQDDGSYEMVLGLSQSDGILGLDLSLQYDPDSVSIESLTTEHLARSFQLDSRQLENGTHGISLFSPIPMQGTGEFLVVRLRIKGALSGLPFAVTGQANEGAIQLFWEADAASGGPRDRNTKPRREAAPEATRSLGTVH